MNVAENVAYGLRGGLRSGPERPRARERGPRPHRTHGPRRAQRARAIRRRAAACGARPSARPGPAHAAAGRAVLEPRREPARAGFGSRCARSCAARRARRRSSSRTSRKRHCRWPTAWRSCGRGASSRVGPPRRSTASRAPCISRPASAMRSCSRGTPHAGRVRRPVRGASRTPATPRSAPVVIRPEDVVIGRAGEPGVPGEVLSRTFYGHDQMLRVPHARGHGATGPRRLGRGVRAPRQCRAQPPSGAPGIRAGAQRRIARAPVDAQRAGDRFDAQRAGQTIRP